MGKCAGWRRNDEGFSAPLRPRTGITWGNVPEETIDAKEHPLMHIHTISAYETSAEEFFKRLVDWKVDLVVDTRLKNTNQLAGFTKRDDLAYFVEELVHARYVHDKLFAPAPTMMERYIHGNIGWDAYADAYREDMREREAVPQFFDRYGDCESVALVGTATRSRRSHVEVLAEMLEEFQKE